jgi:hypothetical protein
MTKKPDKIKRRPSRIDDVTWALFARACGDRCCACTRKGRLHQGHITRHADGGQLTFENLIPLCKACNSKYKGGFTPDTRPEGWRTAFWTLLLAENNVAIICKQVTAPVNTSLDTQLVDKEDFINLKAVEFVAKNHYTTGDARTPQIISAEEARRLMWKLYDLSQETEPEPSKPFRKRQDELMQIATRLGAQRFLFAGAEFVRQQPWVRQDGSVKDDCWADFCASSDKYLSEARVRAARRAEAEKRQREQEKQQAEEAKIWQNQRLWKDYELAMEVPDYPGMPEADREFRDSVQVESEEMRQRALEVVCRYRHYLVDELLAAKQALRKKLSRCAKWALDYDDEAQQEHGKAIKRFSEWIDMVKTIEALRNNEWQIDEFYNSLDPDRPPFDPDTDNF